MDIDEKMKHTGLGCEHAPPSFANETPFGLHRKSECTRNEKKQQKNERSTTTRNNSRMDIDGCLTLTSTHNRAVSAWFSDKSPFGLHTKRLLTSTFGALPDFCCQTAGQLSTLDCDKCAAARPHDTTRQMPRVG